MSTYHCDGCGNARGQCECVGPIPEECFRDGVRAAFNRHAREANPWHPTHDSAQRILWYKGYDTAKRRIAQLRGELLLVGDFEP